MLRNSFSVYPRSVKTKHRSQFLSYDHQIFFWVISKRFLKSHRFDFFDFFLHFWKNRFFCKFFVFVIEKNILPDFEYQILVVKTWILQCESIQRLQYLSYCHQFFFGGSFGSIKRKRKLYFYKNRLQMLKNRIFWWICVCQIW